VHDSDEPIADAARAALEQARSRGWSGVEVVPHARGALPAERVAALASRGVDVVLFLGADADLEAFSHAAATLGWRPFVLLPGSLAARAAATAPAAHWRGLRLAYPALPSDERPAAREALGAGGAHRAARVAAYDAAELLLEGLRRSGKHLSRERLVDQLEAVYAFEPGLSPPLTYGRNRRVGALGAHVVEVDPVSGAFRPLRWVPLD
jgi:ABC-type branched-subunit amino acid transport system substrate-binding protein